MVGPCPCGMYPCYGCSSMRGWAPAPATSSHYTPYEDSGDYYSSTDTYYSNDYSSASVDCTLSLGTPATRRNSVSDTQERRRSNFCGWDFLQTKNSSSSSSSSKKSSSHRNGSGGSNVSAAADPLLARRCTNCDTTSTPLWRNGPRGPKSLCNACGIRYKKEERRASAAAATNAAGGGMVVDSHVSAGYYNAGSWTHQYQPEKVQYFLHVHDFTH